MFNDEEMKLFENRTELEIKAVQFFRDVLKEPFDEETLRDERHLLQPFYDGYSTGNYNQDNDPEVQKRIDEFLMIVKGDLCGMLLYTPYAYEKVFGLIKELGL